jgi:opacity protein-like surface antigen
MKKLLASIIVATASVAAQATTLVMTGIGQEKIGTLTVDLYQVGVGKRFDNGVSFAGSIMVGHPDRAGLVKETRPELTVGYDRRIGNFVPYASVLLGQRQVSGRNDVDYHAIRVGTRYRFTNKFYGDVSYRYRDTNDMQWQSHLYSAGVGVNLNKTTSLQVNYGKTTGDYTSKQTSLMLINRF